MNQQPTYTIEDVHNDFNIARTKIYEEAQYQINTCNFAPNPDLDRLAALGFQNDEVKSYKEAKSEFQINQDVSNYVMGYKVRYPRNRFINHKELVVIINKYSLTLSTVENFIGQIPERNIREIASFKLKEEDVYYVTGTPGVIGKWEFDDEAYNKAYTTTRLGNAGLFGQTMSDFQRFVNDGSQNFGLVKSKEDYIESLRLSRGGFRFERPNPTNQDTFIIVGTQDQFNMEAVNNQKQSLLQNDPIVLCPVPHGYLIVTMWGEEANLPETKDISDN